MKSKPILKSDFWWLPQNIAIPSLLVGVGHHNPLTDQDDPRSIKWFHSLDEDDKTLSNTEVKYGLGFLNKWRGICKNTNIYRTLEIFDRNTQKAILLGPFLIDIDNSGENLDDAQDLTKQVVSYLTKSLCLSLNDLRIFFSGRKGFNVEVRPQAFNINGSIQDQIKLSSKKLDEIIAFLRNKNAVSNQGAIIDRIYGDRFGYKLKNPYIRLHDSINEWIRDDGSKMARMRIELTIEQLQNIKICSEVEELARISRLA